MANWEKAAAQMRQWFQEGKNIPYYDHGHFYPFICKMHDREFKFGNSEFDEEFDYLYKQIAGPYGWAVIQILIIKYRERLNQKWREINEQKATTRLQND